MAIVESEKAVQSICCVAQFVTPVAE